MTAMRGTPLSRIQARPGNYSDHPFSDGATGAAGHAPRVTAPDLGQRTLPCQADPELWYKPVGTAETEQAKRICLTDCPRQAACLAYSLAAREEHGTWGGLDEEQRARRLGRRRFGRRAVAS